MTISSDTAPGPGYPIPGSLEASEIAELLAPESIRIVGDATRTVTAVASLGSGGPGALVFCDRPGEEGREAVAATGASVVLCDEVAWDGEDPPDGKTLLVARDPRAAFARCLRRWFPERDRGGVHPTAVIGGGCDISPSVTIGPYVSIGEGVMIGEGTVIDGGVRIHDRVRIGKDCRIRANAVLGSDGLAYARRESGALETFPHLGSLLVGDDVDVGAGAVLVRGILRDTVVASGARLGNMVNIGHNTFVGPNAFVSAGAILCGSSSVGEASWIAPQSVVRNSVGVGRGATVGLGAVVIRDVPDGTTVVGNPSRVLRVEGGGDD